MKILNSPFRLILFVTFLTASLSCVNVSAQTTAFTYQGRLANPTDAVTGVYDLAFTLFSTGTGGSALTGPITNAATLVTNGLFAATVQVSLLTIDTGEQTAEQKAERLLKAELEKQGWKEQSNHGFQKPSGQNSIGQKRVRPEVLPPHGGVARETLSRSFF